MVEKIQALILDIDGVIWRNKVPIGDLENLFSRITARGLKYAFATNNSTKTIETYVELLREYGIPVGEDQVFTSGSVTAQYLLKRFPEGGNVFVVGMPGLKQTVNQAGFGLDGGDPLAVVVGLDETFDYQTLKTASDFVRQGVPFIGTNPDVSLPTPQGFNPGTGSLLVAIQAASGVEPVIIGKPKAEIFSFAFERLAVTPENALVIGDRLETDIAGGQAAGCQVGVVLTGVSDARAAREWRPTVDYIAEDLTSLIEEIDV